VVFARSLRANIDEKLENQLLKGGSITSLNPSAVTCSALQDLVPSGYSKTNPIRIPSRIP